MFKVGHLHGDEWVEHTFPKKFFVQTGQGHSPRILATVASGDIQSFTSLTLDREGPHHLLYVLHTPRGEGQPGRYQSPLLSDSEVNSFLNKFESYLSRDARFDLWSHSPSEGSTLVWDRHNYLFAYGPINEFRTRLLGLGYAESDEFCVPSPHQHNYHAEFDADATAVLGHFPWVASPLQPTDEQ